MKKMYLFFFLMFVIISCEKENFNDDNRVSEKILFFELCEKYNVKAEKINVDMVGELKSISLEDFKREVKIWDGMKNNFSIATSNYIEVRPFVSRDEYFGRLRVESPKINVSSLDTEIGIAIDFTHYYMIGNSSAIVYVNGLQNSKVSNVQAYIASTVPQFFIGDVNFDLIYIIEIDDCFYSITQPFSVSVTFQFYGDYFSDPVMIIRVAGRIMEPVEEPQISLPDMLSSYIGTDDYYIGRINDFKRRYPDRSVPDFYRYADFYSYEFMYNAEFNPALLDKMTSFHRQTQQNLSNYLQRSPTIELQSSTFKNIAINNIASYVNPIIVHDINLMDQLMLVLAFYPSDLFSARGINWIKEIQRQQINAYQINRAFALQHARELMQNWTRAIFLIDNYISTKTNLEPRDYVDYVQAPDRNTFVNMILGPQIDYFEKVFGDEVWFQW